MPFPASPAIAPDQLRQRAAFALSEILVVSDTGPLNGNGCVLADYYDTLLDSCFGNFRDILKQVTLSPAMGVYLDMRANSLGNIQTGLHPNENYAREILQLFSAGLYRTWPDGTLVLDSSGNAVPTYHQDVISGMARVFTGWNWGQPLLGTGRLPTGFSPSSNYLDPMVLVPSRHELGSKILLDNVILPAATNTDSATTLVDATAISIQTTDPIKGPGFPVTTPIYNQYDLNGLKDLEATMDNIMANSAVGPYICRQLIQRLVTSQPKPEYVHRVVRAFNGEQNIAGDATGIRGDMKEVFRAILLDYEALICVFLNGGNDSNNLIIPTIPAEWDNYAAIRSPVLAIPNTVAGDMATALAMNSHNGEPGYPAHDFHTYGFHPAMPEMQILFNAGVVAPVFNVGTLSFPLTKAQYSAGSVPRPPQLFSHSDQQTQWQTSLPDQPYTSGWGGRIADLFTAANYNQNGGISMAVTLAGSNIFEVSSSNLAPPYAITTSGAVQLSGFSGNASNGASNIPRKAALDAILASNKTSPNLQTRAYAGIFDHAIDQADSLTLALATNASASWLGRFTPTITTPNGGATFTSGLMSQMKMVARLIELGSRPVANGGLGMKRQIFFIQVGGYDTHTNQTNNQGSTTAVDQYAATIASWFGVDAEGINTVFPNLGRFATPNLGFL